MRGLVKNIVAIRSFGFIRSDGQEYFFHREDYNDAWTDLELDMQAGVKVEVEFDSVPSNKGLRAGNVTRVGRNR